MSQLTDLYMRTLRDAYAGTMPREFTDPVGEEEHASKLRAAIVAGTRTWLIALAGRELVGGCALTAARDRDLPSDFGEITTLAVAEPHRRHGHGRALLNAARSHARHQAWRSLVLWVVESNGDARTFYARANFVLEGSVKVDDRLGFSAALVRYQSDLE